jgi:mRNA-degrading endonuclease toxin of MazEF toxin-antitoxin module
MFGIGKICMNPIKITVVSIGAAIAIALILVYMHHSSNTTNPHSAHFAHSAKEQQMAELPRKPKQTIRGERAVFKGEQNYPFPPEDVFRMLCPVREYDYIPPWECDIVYLDSGFAEQGGVFTTHFPGDGDQKDVWVISRHDTNQAVEFVRVNGLRSMIYRIELEGTQTGGTVARWEQIVTGLTEEGNKHVGTLKQSDFTAMLAQMEEWLQHYLATGGAAKP